MSEKKSGLDQALEQEHVKTVADLQGITPGLRFTAGGNTISIRGIASNGAAPTTGVYIDDTPIQLFNVGDSAQNTFWMQSYDISGTQGSTVTYKYLRLLGVDPLAFFGIDGFLPSSTGLARST